MPATPRGRGGPWQHCGCASACRKWDRSASLPTRLDHAGNFPAEREPAETDAAHLEFADIAARAAADAAAVPHTNLVFQFFAGLRKLRDSRHSSPLAAQRH